MTANINCVLIKVREYLIWFSAITIEMYFFVTVEALVRLSLSALLAYFFLKCFVFLRCKHIAKFVPRAVILALGPPFPVSNIFNYISASNASCSSCRFQALGF